MLTIKIVRRNLITTSLLLNPNPTQNCYLSTAQAIPRDLTAKDVFRSFKEWFKSSNVGALDLIFQIVNDQNEEEKEERLSKLGLRLSEPLVLDILSYGRVKYDVLSCLKFFDWAGHQRGFRHTRATFHAIFKILAKAKLVPLIVEFLNNYRKYPRIYSTCTFHNILVMGYAVAGQPRVALQVFGKMRFKGLDLDSYAYHILLNALVEEGCFEAVDAVSKQICLRGFEDGVTHAIMVKSLCRQKLLDEAEEYLRGLRVGNDDGHALCILVDAHCRNRGFEKAGKLIEEFGEMGVVPMDPSYGVWIKNLTRAGKVDESLQFLQIKRSAEGYVPGVFRYNFLLFRLLKENRLKDVYDLLMEMKENKIYPDKVTMNVALCFFCKAGMVGIALDLHESKSEFRLSPNAMAYNFLINALCGDGSIDEAYYVLQNSIKKGFFPGRRTFSILADALCREEKVDKMKQLVLFAFQHNFNPSNSTYEKYVSALCRVKRVEDAYLIFSDLNRMNRLIRRNTYSRLILGFKSSKRGDIAARLLVEMQGKGYSVTRSLFLAVLHCLLEMENPEMQFLKLLEMQLYNHGATRKIYNFFIEGAGRGRKPELAREVFEMMQRGGIEPNLASDILVLQAYLKSERISDALNFFDDLRKRREIKRKLYNAMVVGLCKVNRVDLAFDFIEEMRSSKLVPSHSCYEALIQQLCESGKYENAIKIIYDLASVGRQMTSFIGNLLLLHSMKSKKLSEAWVQFMDGRNEIPKDLSVLGQLVGIFSGFTSVSKPIEMLEEMMEECFPLEIFTYNMLLKRLTFYDMDLACKLFDRMCQKGYDPDKWTYDIIVHGFLKHGRTYMAIRWMEEMLRKGFDPNECTHKLILR